MGQAAHEDDAHFLCQRLLGDGHTGGGAAGVHDDAVFLDHPLGRGPRRIALGLGVASDVLDLFAQQAVPLEGQRLDGVQHAAIAFAVNVLDRKLVGAQFVCPFVRIGTGLRHIEPELDALGVARIVAKLLRPGVADEKCRRDGSACRERGASLQEGAALDAFVDGRHAEASPHGSTRSSGMVDTPCCLKRVNG